MALMFSLREFGQVFATRGRAAELREMALGRCADELVLTIDFADVTNVSYSFADELVGKLAADYPDGPQIDLANMTGTVEQTVRRARERRTGVVAC